MAGLIDPVLVLIVVMGIITLGPGVVALRRPWQMLSAPVVVGGFFAYFYVLLPSVGYSFHDSLYLYSDRMYLVGILVAMLSILAFYGGWRLRTPSLRSSRPRRATYYSARLLYIFGAALVALGILGYVTCVQLVGGWAYFFSKPHALAMRDVPDMTAYIYDVPRFIYPGILLMLQSVLSIQKPAWFRGKALLVAALSVLFLCQAVLRSSRQDSFFLLATWIFVTYLMRCKPPSRLFLGASLLVAGLVPLLLVTYRAYIYVGTDISRVSELDSSFVAHVATPGTANEFLLHSALVSACFDDGEYDYGQQIPYAIFFNFIPRFLWHEKPYNMFRVNPDRLIHDHWGWDPARGSAFTGAASVFFEWGFVGLMFWFLLGRWSRRLFENAKQGSSKSIAIYTGLVCVLFVFTAQDIWAGLKNAVFMFVPLSLAYMLAEREWVAKNLHSSPWPQKQAPEELPAEARL